MNARRAARELALLTLFQMDKQGNGTIDRAQLQRESIQTLVLSSVRALSGEAEFQIRTAADQLAEVSRYLLEYEMEHPSNLETPMEAQVKPVPIPTTRDMVEKIEKCLESAEYLFEALRIPELVALLQAADVQEYALKLMTLVAENQAALDDMLNNHMEDWRMDRLIRMDAYLLRIAAAEMKYLPEVDLRVSINEAVDLAKQFSGEESYKLVNGVLGGLAGELSTETGKSMQGVYPV
ncbi:MAG: transcription antitermination factor NusB [Vampirovibrio sp.]|jgi:N utilization substance protein B|nr:transcription antitermination factor NusB [Vampirovibrio sp.]